MSKLKVNRIPEELTAAPQWVVWRFEERDGKRTKPPYQITGRPASHSDPSTWTTFQRALTAYHSGGWDGIGFVLSDEDPLAGIDLDHCITDDGEVEGWALEIIERVNSYTEISPSGHGVRIFLKGSLPEGAPKGGRKLNGRGTDGHGAIEFYQRLRYLTVTGRHLSETPLAIEERDEVFQALFKQLCPEKEKPVRPVMAAPQPVTLDDTELLATMFGSRNGASILRLWSGDTSAHHDDDSAADLALCAHLAFWCNGDAVRMDRLFRQSRLYREKWDEQRGDETYGQRTLGTALSDFSTGYEGPSQSFSVSGDYISQDPAQQDALNEARALAETLPEKLRNDTGAVYQEEMILALGMLRALDAAAWQRARTAMQKARVALRAVEARLSPVSTYLPVPEGDTEGTYAGDLLDGCPAPTLIVPSPYYIERSATGKKHQDDKGKMRREPFAWAPILPIGRTRDAQTGAESLLLWFQWVGGPGQTRLVERSQALTSKELSKLSAFGLPVGDDNARDLVAYIHRTEAANRTALPCAKVSSHLGWQGTPGEAPFLCGRALILPDGEVETVDALDVDHPERWSDKRICFHGVGEGQDQVVDAFHSAGSFERWLQAVSILQRYPKALLMFYAALCPPLLPLFNVPNFIVDMAHETTVGKTTALRAALSIWGCPDERSACSVMQTWDASRVGLERISEVINGLPLGVDDTQKAKSEKIVADLIYAVCSGRGRVRGTVKGLAHTPHWRTVMLSTGERSATSFTQHGGTRTRVLSLGGMPFGSQSAEQGRLTAKLNAQVCTNYGHAGPRFLAWLQLHRPSWPEWQEHYAELVEYYTDRVQAPEAGRLAAYAALVDIAGEMAHEALNLPWPWKSPVESLWGELSAGATDAAGSVRALEDILSWASSHEHLFLKRVPGGDFFSERTPPAVYGRWDPGEDWPYLAIYPTVLDEALKKMGYTPDSIKKSWRERGWIEAEPGKFTARVPVGSGTESRRMVKLLRLAFGEENALE